MNNGWISMFRSKDSTLSKETANTIRINKDNILYLSLYNNRVEITFVTGVCQVFYFTDWDITF